MSVTVVVPTVGRSPDLRGCVERLIRSLGRTGPDAEVLVVVNGRADAPALAGLHSPLLRVLFLDRANVARARNVGIAAARNDTVLFGDDGGVFEPTWCTDLADALGDPRYPVVTAPVAVPVLGPVTAYLDYQRVFDAPPIDAEQARTVTGNCGIRRDRLPPEVRYDEDNLPFVAEDVVFGHAVRAAGLRIRWLADIAPAEHLLAERVDEITERAYRYGAGAALVWCGHNRPAASPVAGPAAVLALYRCITAVDYRRYRRFTELRALTGQRLRAAFTVYDYLYDVAYLVGYLAELGNGLQHTFIDLDLDGLRAAWQDIAARAAAEVVLAGEDWTALPVDFDLFGERTDTCDPLVVDVRRALDRYAPLVARHLPAPAGTGNVEPAPDGVAAPDLARLHAAWRDLHAGGGTVDAAAVNRAVRAAGTGFRDACAALERALLRRFTNERIGAR